MIQISRICSALALAVISTPALAQEAIGYVAMLEGTAQLTRTNATRDLMLGETILRGDRISADPPASVRIDTRGSNVTICGRGKSASDCRRAFDGGAAIVPAGNWWSRGVTMMSWFRSSPSNLVTRGPNAPLLLIGRHRPQKLVGGTRALSLVWAQGEGPFEITLTGGGRPAVSQKTTDGSITLPSVGLSAGSASITIKDKENRSTTTAFTIVAAPAPIPDMEKSAVNREHQVVLEAMWLASHEDGAWIMEAYQRLQAVADKVPAATSMQRALAAGDRP